MKIKKIQIVLLFLVLVSIWSCKESNDLREKKYSAENIELVGFDTMKLADALELTESVKINQFSNFRIVYFDKNALKLYLEIDSQKNIYYFTHCSVDSLIKMNLLNDENEDLIYVGKFKFISEIYGDFSFFAINTYNAATAKHVNIFCDYFILDNNSTLDLVMCDKFIDGVENALMVNYTEGTGNYLDFRIYGLIGNNFKNIFEPKTPLENGLFVVDSAAVFVLEGINSSKIFFDKGQIRQEIIAETPIFNLKKNDKILELDFTKKESLNIPKLIFLDSQSSLHIVIKENSLQEATNIKINFDVEFFDQNFNTYVPKKSGLTTFEFVNPDNIIIAKIKVIIR
jgi:hypothetical protein